MLRANYTNTMNNKNIPDKIFAYLKTYADSPYGKYPEPSSELVKFLRRNPRESFNIIASYSFQKPENLDFRDMGDPLCSLLKTFVDLVPDLLIPKMTIGFWGARYLFISSAAASKSSKFIPTIVSLLTDRSFYIKLLVLDLVVFYPHLQIPEVLPKLEKLSKMKSIQDSERCQKLLEQAKQCISSKL